MKIGVVGLGYWGPNIVRNLLANRQVSSLICYDANPKKMEHIKIKFPTVQTAPDYKILLKDPEVIAVAIVSPVSTHYPLAKEALQAGKHVLIEKPMTNSAAHAEELIALAQKQGLVLMVDHTFIFNGAVRKIKDLVRSGEVGDIFYFDSVRVNLGLFQHDVNVLWDLAPHDISIMDHIIGAKPKAISALGVAHFNGKVDMAYLTVLFANSTIAHFHANWLSPVKIRKILIGGSKKMIVYDDMDPSEKVKIYDKGVDAHSEEMVHNILIQYRMGDMYAPQIDQTEALKLMIDEFVECVKTGRRPLTDGEVGLFVVRVLEAADASLLAGGHIISLEQ
jgi:predicted dehydrogenase